EANAERRTSNAEPETVLIGRWMLGPFGSAANELHAFAREKGIHWRSRKSASFCRFQGRLSVDMTELRSTATSRILLPMKLRHSLVREAVHWPFRGSPASGGLRAGSALPRPFAGCASCCSR